MTLFSQFGLAEPILKALASEGYVTPTPIQAQAIPHVLEGRDLCGIAQTGTGKTAAFALPILNRLAASPKPAPRKGCRVLVLSPTRELAGQIADSFRTYGRHLRLKTAVVFGGVNIGRQEREMAALLAEGHDRETGDTRAVARHDGDAFTIGDHRGDAVAAIFPAEARLDEIARHHGQRLRVGHRGKPYRQLTWHHAAILPWPAVLR